MNQLILNRICEIASDIFGGNVSEASSPETVPGWDSVQHLNLMLAIEAEYGFQFLPEEMERAKSIGKIAGLVAARQ